MAQIFAAFQVQDQSTAVIKMYFEFVPCFEGGNGSNHQNLIPAVKIEKGENECELVGEDEEIERDGRG
jgi:hypothetical protein